MKTAVLACVVVAARGLVPPRECHTEVSLFLHDGQWCDPAADDVSVPVAGLSGGPPSPWLSSREDTFFPENAQYE